MEASRPPGRRKAPKTRIALIVGGVLAVVGAAGAALLVWGVNQGADKAAGALSPTLEVEVLAHESNRFAFPATEVPSMPPRDVADPYTALMDASLDVGGGPVDPFVNLFVSGANEKTVLIQEIAGTNVDCNEPDMKLWAQAAVEGGGAVAELRASLILKEGSRRTPAVPLPPMIPTDDNWKYPRQLTQAEGEIFLIEVAAPEDQVCTFDLAIKSTTAGGKAREVTVKNPGGGSFVAYGLGLNVPSGDAFWY